MIAHDIAMGAAQLVSGDREASHGDKLRNHENIATLWNAYLQIRADPAAPLSALDVVLMMDQLKTARTQLGQHNPDDYVDKVGYSACAGEIAERLIGRPTGWGG